MCHTKRTAFEFFVTTKGFLRGYEGDTLRNFCSVEVAQNHCIYNMQAIQKYVYLSLNPILATK